MNKENRIISNILISKGIGFIGVVFGIMLILIGDNIKVLGIGYVIFLLGIFTIILSSIFVLISMILHVVTGRKRWNLQFPLYGLVGLLVGSILLFFTWVILVIHGGVNVWGMIFYLIANAVILLSLGIPLFNIGGKPYILSSILFACLFIPVGYFLELPSLIIVSLVFPLLLMGIGSLICAKNIGNYQNLISSKLVPS